MPNEPAIFELAAFIDRRQGRWEDSTHNLARALELDPRNTYILQQIAVSYQLLRRFAEAATVLDRALEILPNDVGLRIARAGIDLHERADPRRMHATIAEIVGADPSAAPGLADEWFYLALCERDFTAADRAIAAMTPKGYNNEGVRFPRSWCRALSAWARGDARAAEAAFRAARAEVEENLQTEGDQSLSLCVLGMIDAALGRKDQALDEARDAAAILPVSKDAINGPLTGEYLAVTQAWLGDKEAALGQLRAMARVPSEVSYGQLRLHPFWDSLRDDPRFEPLVASLQSPLR